MFQTWSQLKDPVLHIELRRWADLLVIAPLDANTLAKIAHGICDNLLVVTGLFIHFTNFNFLITFLVVLYWTLYRMLVCNPGVFS